jgi:hypothetical protein
MAAASTLAGWAAERRQWADAAGAYRVALTIAAGYAGLQMSRRSTVTALEQLRPLSADASYALGQVGAGAEAAVTLERGRAVLLARALALDSITVKRLAVLRPPLAERFRAAVDRLAALTSWTDGAPLTGRSGAAGARARP